MAEQGTMPEEPFTDVDMNEQRVKSSLEVLAQFGFTDNMSYSREILRRDTFSVTMPKLNCLVSSEYDLHGILNKHMIYVQKALGLNPVYWTIHDAFWLLRKLPKPIRTQYVQPPLPMSADSNMSARQVEEASRTIGGSSQNASNVPNSRLV